MTSVTGENGFVATPVAVINPPGTWHRDHFVGGTGSFMTVDLAIDDLQEGFSWHNQSPFMLAQLTRLAAGLDRASTLELEDCTDWLSGSFEPRRQLENVSPSRIALVWQCIMDSDEPWALTSQQLASIAGMHPNSLPRAFRNQYGMAPSVLAKRRQVELCGLAMTKGDHRLAELAPLFGFYDQAHFTNCFKSITSVTPSIYLKNLLRC